MELARVNVVLRDQDQAQILVPEPTGPYRMQAVVDDVDDSVIVKALREIEHLPWRERPKALRMFATARVVAPDDASVAYAAWIKTIERTKTIITLCAFVETEPSFAQDLDFAEKALVTRWALTERFAANPPFTPDPLFTQKLAVIQARAMARYGVVSTERLLIGMSELAYREFRYRCTLELRYAAFLETGDAWKPMVRTHSPFPTLEGTAWASRTRAHYRNIESMAYAFVKCEADAQTAPAPDADDDLLQTYIDITLEMQHPGNVLGCLEKVLRLPLGFQPVALDRWAALIRHPDDKTHGEWLVQKVAAWRKDVVSTFVTRGAHGMAVRAYVAELRAALALCSPREIHDMANDAAAVIFRTFPPGSGGDMLALLAECQADGSPLFRPDTLAGWTFTFMICAESRMRFSSAAFANHLGEIAGSDFASLPDIPSENESTLMAFCERMAIQVADRREFHRAVLRRIAGSIPATPLNRRLTVRNVLGQAGLLDQSTFAFVLKAVQARIDTRHGVPR